MIGAMLYGGAIGLLLGILAGMYLAIRLKMKL